MFFPKKITQIRPQDKVLEIGPGSFPHPRSNSFLELDYGSVHEKISQRGGLLEDANFGNRPVYYYDGNRFPFEDNQFDYVISSHVVEHVVYDEESGLDYALGCFVFTKVAGDVLGGEKI